MASAIELEVNGVSIIGDVLITGAKFMAQASGSPGTCKFSLKDNLHLYNGFSTGQKINLYIDGDLKWSGLIQTVSRRYFFPYFGAPLRPRAIVIEGVDANVLFRKRYLFNKANPADVVLKSWPRATDDDVQIRYMCANFLDLSLDDIDYVTKVEHVGTPNPDAVGNPAGGSWSWEAAMKAIARYPGAIFYIDSVGTVGSDPVRYLVYTDVDTPSATYGLSDAPGAQTVIAYSPDGGVVWRDLGVVADVWISGHVYTWGDVIVTSNPDTPYFYCETNRYLGYNTGTSGSVEPDWPTGDGFSDGGGEDTLQWYGIRTDYWGPRYNLPVRYPVIPTVPNGHVYRSETSGITAVTEPTWPTGGGTVTDGNSPTGVGSIVWQDLGTVPAVWQASTSYSVGDRITVPTGRFEIRFCILDGVSDTSEPDWTTGPDIVDGTTEWYSYWPWLLGVDGHAYGDYLAPGNGHLYQPTTYGSTGTTEPSWPTGGGTVSDGYGVPGSPPANVPDPYWVGYREMELPYNGSNLVNDAMVWGAGQGAKQVKFARTRDQDSIDAHGLWQAGEFRQDLWRQTSVTNRSSSFVYGSPQNKRGGKDDAISVKVVLFRPLFRVAEKVHFISTVFGYDDIIPVRRMEITFPTPTDARFELILSHYIDEPWDTFEYWFPPITIPHITIIPGENCPVPSFPVPYDDGTTQSSLGTTFYSVFSDNFERPPEPLGGQWFTVGVGYQDPPIADGSATLTRNGTFRIDLDQAIYGDSQIIASVDLTSWANAAPDSSNILYFGFDVPSGLTGAIYQLQPSLGGPAVYGPGPVDNPVAIGFSPEGPLFIRLVNFVGAFSAVKVWPQDQAEPVAWTATGPAIDGGANRAYFSWAGNSNAYGPVLLNAMTVFADTDHPDLSSAITAVAGQTLLPTRSQTRTWPFSDPMDGRVYGVSWGSYSLTGDSTVLPAYSFGLAWNYFGPDWGPGAPSYAAQSVAGITLVQGAIQPVSIRITGKVYASIGRSTGVDDRAASRSIHGLTVLFDVYPQVNDYPNYYQWTDWYALGRTIGTKYFVVESETGTLLNGEPPEFDFEIPSVNEYVHPFGAYDGVLSWGVRIQDPLGQVAAMSPEGGPFLLPNTGAVFASTSDVQIYAVWPAVPSNGNYFCNPATGSGISGDKQCDDVPIDQISLHDLYANGNQWAIQVSAGSYVPSTVEVSVDGTTLQPGLDFIEASPGTGVVKFLNSFLNATSVTVCYIPGV